MNDKMAILPNAPVVWEWLNLSGANYSIIEDNGVRMTVMFDSKYHANWALSEVGNADKDGSFISGMK